MIAAVLLIGTAAAQGCPDLGETLREATSAIDEVRLEDAQVLLDRGTDGLECQTEVVNSLTLVGLYQSAGAVEYFLGNFNEADDAFARAIAVAPASRLDPAYGEGPATIYEKLREATLSASAGSLTGPEPVEAWVDGRPLSADYPLDIPPGFHLIQVATPSGGLLNTVHRIAPGEALVVTRDGAVQVKRKERPADAPPPEQPVITGTTTSGGGGSTGGRRVGMLAAGGVGLAGGAVLMVLASFSHQQFFQATDVDQLDSLRLRTNALGGAGVGLAAVGAGMLGVGVIPRQSGAEVLFTWRF